MNIIERTKTTKKLQSFNFEDEKVSEICRKLFTKNIFDLRIVTPTDDEKLVEMIADFWRSKMEGERKITSKLRDLDLTLQTAGDTKVILEALSDNYMIKTVRLSNQSRQRVDEETLKLAEEFKKNRVGTEIRISYTQKQFKKSKKLRNRGVLSWFIVDVNMSFKIKYIKQFQYLERGLVDISNNINIFIAVCNSLIFKNEF